jgi:MFS family permease
MRSYEGRNGIPEALRSRGIRRAIRADRTAAPLRERKGEPTARTWPRMEKSTAPLDRRAYRFVLLMSVVSLFADAAYEGGRSAAGQLLAHLGAGGLVVGIVGGLGELLNFVVPFVSGRIADRTRRYWPGTFTGYALNVFSVPALAFARSWPVAAVLLLAERFGRGIRRPTARAMLSYAGSRLGQGWVFGLHEALDQTGATLGPLAVALVLAVGGGFPRAFAVLAIPAILAMAVLIVARLAFPAPHEMEAAPEMTVRVRSLPYWLYLAAAACSAAGFADFSLVAYHLAAQRLVGDAWIAVLYAFAMIVAAAISMPLGRLYDRHGGIVVTAAFALSAAYAPLAFLGHGAAVAIGIALWGVGMGAQDALLPPVVARLTPRDRRAGALGTFDAAYGIAWFLGSVAMGALYVRAAWATVAFALVLQLACALPLYVLAGRAARRQHEPIAG